MTETDPERDDPPAQVPDDRVDTAGAGAPEGVDDEGPEPQMIDDRKGAAGSGAWDPDETEGR
ncbi:hypothetical protein ACFYSC_02295 [Streptosporangium sp. NPDC004379]|uniref:hypothetical protein n=1 Tax=Streptosporangium sp. NPDC004379 TaxID=3366189 RepID=UPI0036A235A6